MSIYKEVVFPVLRQFDAERTHEVTLNLLSLAEKYTFMRRFLEKIYKFDDPRLEVKAMDLHFDNPIGLAAGFDKNGVATRALAALGFGHIEVGTITPMSQVGNPRPRIFRLSEDAGLVNRMGFPGEGMVAAKQNLETAVNRNFVMGINAGANKLSVEEGRSPEDYRNVIKHLYSQGDYFVVNVSSPNTARLRDLQGKDALSELTDTVLTLRDSMPIKKPVLFKISPDLTLSEIDDVLEILTARNVQGIIATNTSISRKGLRSKFRGENGGLSGRPIKDISTNIISYVYCQTEGKMPIIGVGGVFNAENVVEKMEAGASLVQVYTGLVYEGPGMVNGIKRDLVTFTESEGISDINVIVGAAA